MVSKRVKGERHSINAPGVHLIIYDSSMWEIYYISAGVRQPWMDLHNCYFKYLIIRLSFLLLILIIRMCGTDEANLWLQSKRGFLPSQTIFVTWTEPFGLANGQI